MKNFGAYVQELEQLAEAATRASGGLVAHALDAALDGQPGAALRRLVRLDLRRKDGAFFSGSELAAQLLEPYRAGESPQIIVDPACGAGDLLVAASRLLPIDLTLDATIHDWAARLVGYDIHPEFIAATKLRLVLAAIRRGASPANANIAELVEKFAGISVGDGIDGVRSQGDRLSDALILTNPPYGPAAAPPGCAWGSGKVSAAALFVDRLLDVVPDGARLAMILPDVTRTGTRYRKWRATVQERVELQEIRIAGLFDRWADVDVFIAQMRRSDGIPADAQTAWCAPASAGHLVGDYFDVHTGPVVPHRDPKAGDWHPFICARLLSGRQDFDVSEAACRRYQGRVFTPPFVVIRRVSRPEDAYRASGTVIRGSRAVAVENHLLVLTPKSGGLSRCRSLMRVLKAESTNRWLNESIRCRHLTVGTVAAIPWSDND
jgi:hypothetical protein